MPTADVCGNCHLQEYAERESERDTILWPKNQWPKGRPSHALDYRANVETEIYAGMSQREIADGCTMCHINQNKCDNCHTRHEFSVANSRKPEACGTCHSGADHINWEAYNVSKHGQEYQASKGNNGIGMYSSRMRLPRAGSASHLPELSYGVPGQIHPQRGA